MTATAWGRLSWHTLDDAEVGDTALTAEYNYRRDAPPGSSWALWALLRRAHGFANVTFQLSEGTGIASAPYLFTPAQLAYTGYQATDNAQKITANAGADLADGSGRTHLNALVTFGSGLRTGPTNADTLPAAAIVDLTMRHRFELPLRPELALDVRNLFDVAYAYRIATRSLAGSAYGPLRTVSVRLILIRELTMSRLTAAVCSWSPRPPAWAAGSGWPTTRATHSRRLLALGLPRRRRAGTGRGLRHRRCGAPRLNDAFGKTGGASLLLGRAADPSEEGSPPGAARVERPIEGRRSCTDVPAAAAGACGLDGRQLRRPAAGAGVPGRRLLHFRRRR